MIVPFINFAWFIKKNEENAKLSRKLGLQMAEIECANRKKAIEDWYRILNEYNILLIDFEKDKFILSAGWKVASLYNFLWKRGRITEEELNSYCQEGSKFIGLAEPIIPEIPFAGGSMGQRNTNK